MKHPPAPGYTDDSPEPYELMVRTTRSVLGVDSASLRSLLVLSALVGTGCAYRAPGAPSEGLSSSAMITVSDCPAVTPGLAVGFYQQIGCNAFDTPLQSVRRWAFAPKLYIRTIDEAGAPIDQVTLDTVANAMGEIASTWTSGRFGLASIERGTETREAQPGWLTVRWQGTDAKTTCGHAQVAVDGGWIELNARWPAACSCGDSRVMPRIAKHELGHALGYWHTDNALDLMFVASFVCDQQPTARELAAAAYQYR